MFQCTSVLASLDVLGKKLHGLQDVGTAYFILSGIRTACRWRSAVFLLSDRSPQLKADQHLSWPDSGPTLPL